MGGVTLLTDDDAAGGVTFAFTERSGGVSEGPYASLNLGDRCGDDPERVGENRRRLLAALGAEDDLERLVCPRQVHGDAVVRVRPGAPEAVASARADAAAGADAVVCTAPGVPVLLCFADCVPVVLVCPGGFAVVHSGWKGTLARVSATAVRALCDEAGVTPDRVCAYVGPHVGAADYEVPSERAALLAAEFGPGAVVGDRNLDLGFAVRAALLDAGVGARMIACYDGSTARETDRFFSYRASGGTCGRHGAAAVLKRKGATL